MLGFGLNHRMWPGQDFMEESLKKLDFLVDVDLFMTDTAKLADLVLPACTSFERSELKFYPQQYVIWTSLLSSRCGNRGLTQISSSTWHNASCRMMRSCRKATKHASTGCWSPQS